jgi:hypothetical protein
MILGIYGFAGAGKDTVADYLQLHYGFTKLSFAAILKDIVSIIFDWDRTMLEGSTVHSREWREQIDNWWARRLNIPHLTPRWVLQQIGTNVFRNCFHDDIWIAAVERQIQKYERVIITDCRFENEFSMLHKLGANFIYIKRGPEPHWVQALRDGDNTGIPQNLHVSERAWIMQTPSAYLENTDTLETLYLHIQQMMDKLAGIA